MAIDKTLAGDAAKAANARFGQWMPEQWLWLFVEEYNAAIAAVRDPAEAMRAKCDGSIYAYELTERDWIGVIEQRDCYNLLLREAFRVIPSRLVRLRARIAAALEPPQ